MKRKRMSKRHSKKLFSKTAGSTKPINLRATGARGGIRF